MFTQDELLQAVPNALQSVDLSEWGEKQSGKVRDIYFADVKRVLITTDRVSAFDRVLGTIPFKGQVLNQLSAWWFKQMADVVTNHVIDVPDPNLTVAHEAETLPVEVHRARLHHWRHQHLALDALRAGRQTPLRYPSP
jgi:phosphoribosylaminoimidazole-succinocarboxamide synthase